MTKEDFAILHEMTVRVAYGDRNHLTTGQGGFDLLDCCLTQAGVKRDAKAAALRAYTEAAVRSYREKSRLDYQAGVITITNEV